jgi:hypothetical protein
VTNSAPPPPRRRAEKARPIDVRDLRDDLIDHLFLADDVGAERPPDGVLERQVEDEFVLAEQRRQSTIVSVGMKWVYTVTWLSPADT